MEEILEKEKIYTFQNVNFENGKAELLSAAIQELDDLANWLAKNTHKRIEIGGHTDNIGTIKNNQILSEKRAEAVYGYLFSKNIPSNQL